MTEKPMTMRERALGTIELVRQGESTSDLVLHYLANILEDTGSPAHMRVAKELRGDVDIQS